MGKTCGVFIGDPHYAGRSIGARMDDYTAAISEKMLESLTIARDYPADYVCILGDLFHQPDPPGIVRNEVLRVLVMGNDGERWPFEILAVIGNHDISGHTVKTLERTAVETLNKSGVIDICQESITHDLFTIHYEHDIESRTFQSDRAIWAIHSYVLPSAFMGPHVLVDDFEVGPRTKVVMCGHWHSGYPVVRRSDGVLFANPGSLGRPRVDDADHEIKIAVVEYDDEGADVRYVPLESAKPAHRVFPSAALERSDGPKVQQQSVFADTLEELRRSFDTKGDSLTLMQRAADLLAPGDDVVTECRNRIEQQRKEGSDDA
jgi:exonuclease SbcD